MSLSTKIFILIMFTIIFLVTCIGVVRFVLFEKLFMEQTKDEYIRLAIEFSLDYDGDVQSSYDLIDALEEKYGLNVIVADQIGVIQYTTVIKGNPWGGTTARWKNDFISIPPDVRQTLDSGQVAVYYTKNETHGTQYINVAILLVNNEILVLETILQNTKESIKFGSRFYAFSAFGAILLGLAFSYLISLKAALPLSKIRTIAKRIAISDYSLRFTSSRNDDIGEIGESLNELADKQRALEKKTALYESRIRQDIEKEKRSERKRQEFLSNVSHELKTPITVINSYAASLCSKATSDEGLKEYCRVIEDEAAKMMELVNELLEITKLDREEPMIKMVNFDLVSLVLNAQKRFEKDFSQKQINFVFCSEHESITVRGEPYRIDQVVTNLLSNAVKYALYDKGVAVKLIKGDKKTIVKVFNTGKGIPVDEMDKIWESFYRVDRTKKTEPGDTGLGLYIVKKVLLMHKSGFGVRNVSGGVEFWFDIENF